MMWITEEEEGVQTALGVAHGQDHLEEDLLDQGQDHRMGGHLDSDRDHHASQDHQGLDCHLDRGHHDPDQDHQGDVHSHQESHGRQGGDHGLNQDRDHQKRP